MSDKSKISFFWVACGTWLCAWALSWLMPNHYPPWVGFHAEAMAIAGSLVFFIAGLSHLRGHPTASVGVSASNAMVWLVALLPVTWHALGRGAFLSDSVLGAFYLATLAMIMLVTRAVCLAPPIAGRAVPTRECLLDGFAWLCFVVGIVSWGVALQQWLLPYAGSMYFTDLAQGDRPYGNFAQPNQFATFMVMGFASAIYLFERRWFGSFAFALSLFVFALSVAMSESRSGAIAVMALLGWAMWAGHKKILKASVRVFGVALVMFVTLSINWPEILQWFGLSDVRGSERLSEHARPILWGQMLAAIIERPALGYGWHGVALAQFEVAAGFAPMAYSHFSHNLFLDLIVWFGLPVGTLLSAVCIVWGWRRICAARDLLAWYPLAAILPIAIHSMLEFPYAYAEFLMPAGFLVGVLESSKIDALRLRIRQPVLWIVMGLLALYWLLLAVEYFHMEDDYRSLRMQAAKIGSMEDSQARSEPLLLKQLSSKIALSRCTVDSNMSAEAIEQLRITATRYLETPLLYRYAKALQLNGQIEESAQVVEAIGQLHGKEVRYQIKSALSGDRFVLDVASGHNGGNRGQIPIKSTTAEFAAPPLEGLNCRARQ